MIMGFHNRSLLFIWFGTQNSIRWMREINSLGKWLIEEELILFFLAHSRGLFLNINVWAHPAVANTPRKTKRIDLINDPSELVITGYAYARMQAYICADWVFACRVGCLCNCACDYAIVTSRLPKQSLVCVCRSLSPLILLLKNTFRSNLTFEHIPQNSDREKLSV